MINLIYVVLFAAAAFLYYGLSCLVSLHLVNEFERFGLPKYRILTGILQLCGAAGLVMGLIHPWLGAVAAAGLALLMLAGFITRISIRDSLLQSAPSFIFLLLNAYITCAFWVLATATKEV